MNIHNLKFFNSKGDNLNLSKIQNQTINIKDSTGQGLVLQQVTNSEGKLIGLLVLNGGSGYSSPEIIVSDNKTGKSYTVPLNDITIESGVVTNIDITETSDFTYPYVSFNGDVYFQNRVPVGLIETEHVFIVEETIS